MKVALVVIGKTSQEYLKIALDDYQKRLKKYFPFSLEVIPDVKNSSKLKPNQLKDKEAEVIEQFLKAGDTVILLDEHGKEFKSKDFANFMQKKMNVASSRIVFIVGGAYGFSDNIKNKYKEHIALSKMTFSHQMIRLLCIEQIYRAMSILNNEPYHNE